MTPTTPQERAEWAGMAEAATPGPWFAWENPSCWTVQTPTDAIANLAIRVRAPKSLHPEANAAFIAAARDALPRLLADLERAEAVEGRVREVIEGLRERDARCRLLAAEAAGDIEHRRVVGKAAAYGHAADLIAAALEAP